MVAISSGSSRAHRPLVAALVVTIVPLTGWAVMRGLEGARTQSEIAATVPQEIRPGFATSKTCEACHPSQYHSWHRGYHRTMTQYATPESVRGAFDNVRLTGGGYDVRLSRQGDEFFAEMVDPLIQYEVDVGQRPPLGPDEAVPRVVRRISMVTGSHHMQAYWVPSNVGNGQFSLPFTYLFNDKRWVPRSEVFLHPPGVRAELQVWNVGCITCHVTAGQPLALVGGKAIKSQVAEMGIACESCHGPGETHVAANQNPLRRYELHREGKGDPTIVNPARLPAKKASEVCGQCHSLTDLSQEIQLGQGKAFTPGANLEDTQPLLRPLKKTEALERYMAENPNYLRNYFWADGTIRVSSRDYSGMVESKCNQSDKLWCGSCHSLHESDPAGLIANGKHGDGACTQCHPKEGAAGSTHTRHAAGSTGSECVNCHMPHTVYGLLKGIRNHRIDSPRVTGSSGGNHRPNACNLCHVDRSLGWAAKYLAEWYGQPVQVAAGADETPAAVSWMLSGDAVLRALAAWQFGWDGARSAAKVDDAVPYLVTALSDPYAAVRYVAGHALAKIMPGIDYDYLASDEARAQAATAILRRWLQAAPARAEAAPAIDARIQQLLGQRDNTPVSAME